MSIALPTAPQPASATPRLLDFGTVLTPPQGGPMQRLNRIGNRFALEVVLPTLTPDQRLVWVSRLLRGMTEGVLLPFPQPGTDPGVPGAPAVNGGGQTGSAIALRGLAAGYVIREGQALSIIFAGRRYLHIATADVTVVGGAGTVPITPMLRISPNDGAPVEITTPMIEGLLSGNDLPWQLRTDHNADITFVVTEAA